LASVEVTTGFDEEAGVWFVAHCQVPGLVREAATLDALFEKVARMAIDLADDNEVACVPVHLLAQREARIAQAVLTGFPLQQST